MSVQAKTDCNLAVEQMKRFKGALKPKWVTERYAVVDYWRDRIVEWAGFTPTVDMFASEKNKRFP